MLIILEHSKERKAEHDVDGAVHEISKMMMHLSGVGMKASMENSTLIHQGEVTLNNDQSSESILEKNESANKKKPFLDKLSPHIDWKMHPHKPHLSKVYTTLKPNEYDIKGNNIIFFNTNCVNMLICLNKGNLS